MIKIELKLDKTKKYVVACSFGPDSMALLSSAIEDGYQIVVAHVNYRKRDASVYEQKSLERFCEEKNIRIFVLDLLHVKHSGNFQKWARETRYKFFKKVCEEVGADGVLVAHQQDDAIETYLIQKKRGNIAKNYGISVENELFGVKIIRPLLGYSKEELKQFDDDNHIPYSIDESNLTDVYTRNKIRHQIVEKSSLEDRQKILEEIENSKPTKIEFKTLWDSEDFCKLEYCEIVSLLDNYMNKTNTHRDLSSKFVSEIKKAFKSKTNCSFEITDGLTLEKDYDEVYLVNTKRVKSYEFKFSTDFKNEMFEIDFRGGAEDRNIPLDSCDLIVKNLDINTQTIIKDYSVNINRLFIDWKVPHFLRKVWPGIFDEKGKLLYVPRYRKEFVDNHKSKFVFRTNYFIEF